MNPLNQDEIKLLKTKIKEESVEAEIVTTEELEIESPVPESSGNERKKVRLIPEQYMIIYKLIEEKNIAASIQTYKEVYVPYRRIIGIGILITIIGIGLIMFSFFPKDVKPKKGR